MIVERSVSSFFITTCILFVVHVAATNQTKQVLIRQSTLTNVTAAELTTTTTTATPPVVTRRQCTCTNGQCGCCTGTFLQSFNQKACANITYEPSEFAFTLIISLNDRVLYKNRISGRNPPPICVRIPQFPLIRICVRLSNIYFTGANMHTCVDIDVKWEDVTLFDLSFECFRIGVNGVAIVPPEDGGGPGGAVDGAGVDEDDDDDDEDDDYDDSARYLVKIIHDRKVSNSAQLLTKYFYRRNLIRKSS